MKTTATIMFLSLVIMTTGALVACNTKKVECENCSADSSVAQQDQVDAASVEDAGTTDQ